MIKRYMTFVLLVIILGGNMSAICEKGCRDRQRRALAVFSTFYLLLFAQKLSEYSSAPGNGQISEHKSYCRYASGRHTYDPFWCDNKSYYRRIKRKFRGR
jgi:hypothetical protein